VIDPKEMQSVAIGRAKTYAVLAALYSAPPTKELAAMICAGDITTDGSETLNSAATELTACFRQAASDALMDSEVVAEYTRLFVLPSGVVPHESFYADENRRIGGQVTVAVRQFYEAAGAQLTGACLELPDHIGVELEFMKFLCDIEAQLWLAPDCAGLRQCLDFQCDFLADHLLQWQRNLCDRVLNESDMDLYRALARLTADFLDAEWAFVPELASGVCSEGRKSCEPIC
jgi:TorA maturation chaperone TorD